MVYILEVTYMYNTIRFYFWLVLTSQYFLEDFIINERVDRGRKVDKEWKRLGAPVFLVQECEKNLVIFVRIKVNKRNDDGKEAREIKNEDDVFKSC